MTRPYTGRSDVPAAGKRPGTEKLVELLCKHYGFRNLGTFGVRPIRGGSLPSVHGSGRAADLGWTDPKAAALVAQWLVDNSEAFLLEELHDYAGTTKPGTETWGRGWRCNRNGKPGWKDYTATDNAGTPGPSSRWYHLEVAPQLADDDRLVVKTWKTLTKLGVWVGPPKK
jgi:hypothetical protein